MEETGVHHHEDNDKDESDTSPNNYVLFREEVSFYAIEVIGGVLVSSQSWSDHFRLGRVHVLCHKTIN